MLSNRIKLFTLLGIDIQVDASWILLAVLIWWTLAAGVFPTLAPDLAERIYWWMAAAGAAGLFASIVFHEMSHALVARHYGIAIRGITLFIFGGVAELESEPERPRVELLMAAAGPVASLVLAGLLLLLTALAWDAAPAAVTGVLWYLAIANGVLAIFNMVPAFPLDGGRVLRAALWAWHGDIVWASRIAAGAGNLFGIILIVLGVIDVMRGDFVGGMWRFLIGMFLRGAAGSSYQQMLAQRAFNGTPVSKAMTADPVSVPPEVTVGAFIEDYVYRWHHRLFPVVRGGELLGQVGTPQAAAVDRPLWPVTAVAQIMLPVTAADVVSPDLDVLAALSRMQRAGRSRLFVVQGRTLLGIVTLRDMLELLSTRLELDPAGGAPPRLWPGAIYGEPQERFKP